MVRADGKMDGAKYGAILEENLLESAKDLRLGRRFTFQQDNDPKHKARARMEWFKIKHIYVLECQSSDLNRGSVVRVGRPITGRLAFLFSLSSLQKKIGETDR